MPISSELEFRNTWASLLVFALRRRVPYQDAEDLVSVTLQIALDRFDGERGEFYPFCITILRNKINNYWRDRKPNDPIEDINLPDSGYVADFEKEEERARMKEMIDRIREKLTDEEREFLNALGTVFEEIETRAVSEAARSLGLEPAKGWDVFRRIQRKAKSLYPALEVDEVPFVEFHPLIAREPGLTIKDAALLQSVRRSMRMPAPPPPMHLSLASLARFALRDESYVRAMDSLSQDQKSKLRFIFSSREA